MNKIQNFVQIISLLAVSCCFFFGSCSEGESSKNDKAPIEYVDPFSEKQLISWLEAFLVFHGPTPTTHVPMLGLPFGMTHWSIQNELQLDDCDRDYSFQDATILSIRPTHWNFKSCQTDYGSFRLILGSKKGTQNFPFDSLLFEKDFSSPNSLHANLPDLNAKLEVSVSERSAIFQIQFQSRDTFILGISPHFTGNSTKINFYPASGEIWVQDSLPASFPSLNMYHLIKTKNVYGNYGIWEGRLNQSKETHLNSNNLSSGFYLEFPLDSGQLIQFKIGSSYWDFQDARTNLTKEIPAWDIEQLKSIGKRKWTETLGKIQVNHKNVSAEELEVFYKSLFWSSLTPRIFSGNDGLYPSFSGERVPEKRESGNFYGDLSMFDQDNHTQYALLSILFPDVIEDIQYSKSQHALLADEELEAETLYRGGKVNLAKIACEEVFEYIGLIPLKEEGIFQLKPAHFNSWKLNSGEENEFQFNCDCPQDKDSEVNSAILNGKQLEELQISRADILRGGKLEVSCR